MGAIFSVPKNMVTTPSNVPAENLENKLAESVREGDAEGLAESVARKVANVVPEGVAEASDESANEEWKRLLALREALGKINYSRLSEDEYRILLDYGCVYAQGEHLKKRIKKELAWFEEKKAVLDDAAGFWGFMKRMKLEGKTIADWFDVEYKKAFPDGTLAYLGYDHAQTTDVVNKRIVHLKDPEFWSSEWPLPTVRAKEWQRRLWALTDAIRKRRGSESGSSDYADLTDVGGIWLPLAVIEAFAIAGMSTPAGEGGFSFWADASADAADGDGDAGGDSDGGGGAD